MKDQKEQIWHRSTFAIAGEGKDYEGFTLGEHWNGWACPAFVGVVAEDVLNTEGLQWVGPDEDDQYVIIREPGDPDQNEVYQGFDIVLEGGDNAHVYAIGAFGWIWDDMAE